MTDETKDLGTISDRIVTHVGEAYVSYINNMVVEQGVYGEVFQAALLSVLEAVFDYRISKLKGELTGNLDSPTNALIAKAVEFAGYQCLSAACVEGSSQKLQDTILKMFDLYKKLSETPVSA